MNQRLRAAAGIARPVGHIALQTRIAAGRVDHAALTSEIDKPTAHLLIQNQRIQVVHFFVVHAVAPLAVGMIANLIGAVQFEAACALTDKLLQMLEPRLVHLGELIHMQPAVG